MKRLAIIGSSGGNLYNQGGNDPKKMMEEILYKPDPRGLKLLIYSSLGRTRPWITSQWMQRPDCGHWMGENLQVKCSEEMTLQEINGLSRKNDEELARLIREDKIDGNHADELRSQRSK